MKRLKDKEIKMKLGLGGQTERTKIMFEKGQHFIIASILLKQKLERTNSVSIHLFAQGLEIIFKSILLKKNYNAYIDLIRDKFGHNLIKLYEECKKQKLLKKELEDIEINELKQINDYYLKHNLKYANKKNPYEILTHADYNFIKSENLLKYSLILIESFKELK